MAIRRMLLQIPLCLATWTAWPAPFSSAKTSDLTPAKVKQIKKTRKSYEACRKDVLLALKNGAITKTKFETQLSTCKENWPGADLYITCKRQAISAARAQNVAEEQAIEQCKRYLTATAFDPDAPVPFFIESGQIYFAGIGLNRSQPVSALKPPNFGCDKLRKAANDPSLGLYLLFGNDPRTFAGLSELKGNDLLKTLKIGKATAKGVDVPDFGRVYGNLRGKSGVVFFPTGACDFEAEPGDLYAGLSAYYLLDAAGNAATPYFGIAYYKSEQQTITTAKLIQAVTRMLGPTFKSSTKNNLVHFIAAASLSETDDEQDPKNLCRPPRPHRFVGVVQARKEKPSQPDYLILANVKSLCDYGDRLGKRLTQ